MTYIRELDELPWEAREGVPITFRYWPKVDGRNVLASSVAGEVTFSVFKPDGVQVQGPTTVTPATVSITSRNISRFDLPVAGLADRGEGYQVRLTFREDGQTFDHFDARTFDVVLWPFDQPRVSLNDMLEERSDLGPTLDRIGQRLNFVAGDDAQERAASVIAIRARWDLYSMVRDAIRQDAKAASEVNAPATQASRRTRPNLILRREPLYRVERFLAMKNVYLSIAKDPEDGDREADTLYRLYRDQAARAWQMVGSLEYDADEDLVGEELVEDPGRVTFHTRVQG